MVVVVVVLLLLLRRTIYEHSNVLAKPAAWNLSERGRTNFVNRTVWTSGRDMKYRTGLWTSGEDSRTGRWTSGRGTFYVVNRCGSRGGGLKGRTPPLFLAWLCPI